MSDADELEFAIQSLTRSSDRRIVALLRGYAKLEAEAQALREEVAALRARVVVWPEEIQMVLALADRIEEAKEQPIAIALDGARILRELARLNGKAVSDGLLRRILDHLEYDALDAPNYLIAAQLVEQLRDMLGQKEGCGHA
ncbi:hypothetical protein N7414_01240 [Pseudomonas sp. GD04087]|uniref:hypothetical protein n=1 Tax=unclassified Pseudomonas TaxID=196821 RepID=UPI00244921A7|nr:MULTISPECIES: hypothetical protein [unclassified Pseudomonas]MDH0287723.1 hypothetical protein [Pseudomonas sp. GD04087]MDH1050852.1 hypothetical protein [Pseudomonas sp. GD03903]MDH1999825.1 hypothetical protein [Pseudomonas sp. GD03691]